MITKQESSLIYRITFVDKITSEDKEHFLFDVIELFVEKNGLLCGGGDYIEIYDPSGVMAVSVIKKKFLLFLSEYSNQIRSLSFYTFNEQEETFIHYETISIV